MSFAMDILAASNLINQVGMIGDVKTKLSGQSNTLAAEIKLDAGRGVDTTKKEKELSDMNTHITDLNTDIGSIMNKAQKVTAQMSKETNTSSGTGTDTTSSKNPAELKKFSQKLSAEVMQLQNDDATENRREIQNLQQKLQEVQSLLQQAETANISQNISVNIESSPAGGVQINDASTGGAVDIAV